MKLGDIRVGERVRKDMGDITSLAESIRRHGLLHPIVVLSDGTLVAGSRRLAAARQLGWSDVPAHVVDVDDLLGAERDENEVRKNFTPTEIAAIGRLLEAREREFAKERQRQAGVRHGRGIAPETVSEPIHRTEEADTTRGRVGKALGVSGPTYQRAKAVVDAAEQSPERYGDLPERMDSAGVLPTFEELRRRQIKNGDVKRDSSIATANARRERVKVLAAKGYTRDQMASELGVGRDRINTYCKELNITVAADVIGKTRRIDSNRVVSETVTALEGLAMGVGLVEVEKLDTAEVEHWATSLSESLRLLNRLAKQLKEMARVSA